MAGFLAQKEFSSNSALHVAAILLVLWAIFLLGKTLVTIAGSPSLSPGIQIAASLILLIFIGLNIAALAGLLGFVSKNSE